jgi:hypothetical protein
MCFDLKEVRNASTTRVFPDEHDALRLDVLFDPCAKFWVFFLPPQCPRY